MLESRGRGEKASIAFQGSKKLKFLDFTASVISVNIYEVIQNNDDRPT